jgi:hypothetical protein
MEKTEATKLTPREEAEAASKKYQESLKEKDDAARDVQLDTPIQISGVAGGSANIHGGGFGVSGELLVDGRPVPVTAWFPDVIKFQMLHTDRTHFKVGAIVELKTAFGSRYTYVPRLPVLGAPQAQSGSMIPAGLA